MGRRGRPPKRPASATSSAEQHMKRVRDICLNSRFVNIGENGKKWQQHRRACEGSQPGFDFVGHLLSLHDVHCSRAPPENVDVKLEVDDEALHGDNGSLDVVQVSLDGDLARQWRHLQKMAGYEAAEMEYLCWLMTVAEQMLGWKSQSEEKDNDDRAEEEDEDYTPEPPRQRRRRTEPTPATAGTSFDSPVYETPTELPEYGLHSGDDSNSGSGGVPGGSRHADSEEEQEDVKPEIEPAQGTLTKFTIKWADKPSTSTAPTSIETETTRLKLESIEGDASEEHLSKAVGSVNDVQDAHRMLIKMSDTHDETSSQPLPAYLPDAGKMYLERLSKSSPKRAPNLVEKFTARYCHQCALAFHDNYELRMHNHFEHAGLNPETGHTCSECDKVYDNFADLKAHMLGEHLDESTQRNIKAYCCTKCYTDFPSNYALLLHTKRVHGIETSSEKPICGNCGGQFATVIGMKAHQRACEKKTNEPMVPCPICHMMTRKSETAAHMKLNHPDSSVKPTCGNCGGQFATRKGLRTHQRYCEKTEEPMVPCSICHIITRKSETAAHMKLNHPEFSVEITCGSCGAQFVTVRGLRTHQRACENTDEPMLPCPVCNIKTKKSKVAVHMKLSHPGTHRNVNNEARDSNGDESLVYKDQLPRERKRASRKGNPTVVNRESKNIPPDRYKPYCCQQCDLWFSDMYYLKRHDHKVHGAEDPPKECICSFCGKGFGTPKLCKLHEKRLHSEAGKVTVRCQVCDAVVKKPLLKIHMKLVHAKEKCMCDICGAALKNDSCLYSHMKTVHQKTGMVQCEIPGCGKSFNRQDNLIVHMRTHSDEKPIACNFCDYRCRQKAALNWHMKKNHTNVA